MLSYQSARSGWKMIFVAALFALGEGAATARPYRDDRRGFELELSDDWRLAPQFGETAAMVFERQFGARYGRRQASLAIRAVDIDGEDVLEAVKAEWGEPVGRAPALPAWPEQTARLKSWRFRPAKATSAEAHLIRVGGSRFLITLRSHERDGARFRRQVAGLMRGFRLLGPAQPAPLGADPVPAERSRLSMPISARALQGRWIRPEGAALEFSADGRYRLADIEGRYLLREDRLELTGRSGGKQRFRVRRRGDRLELISPELSAPLVFERFDPRAALSGTWTAVLPNGTLVLKLGADGAFALGAHRGRWRVDDDRLVLEKSKTQAVSYQWRLNREILTLSGGDLDRPLALSRSGS